MTKVGALNDFVANVGDFYKVKSPREVSYCDVFCNLFENFDDNKRFLRIANVFQVSHTGTGYVSSAISRSKKTFREMLARNEIISPVYFDISEVTEDIVSAVFNSFSPPYLVKYKKGGSAVANSFEELVGLLAVGKEATIIERYIEGKKASCFVLEDFRGDDFYTFPPVATDRLDGIGISDLSISQKDKIREIAVGAHRSLNFRHYSVVEFVITPYGQIYVVDAKHQPDRKLVEDIIGLVGLSMTDFIFHTIALALESK